MAGPIKTRTKSKPLGGKKPVEKEKPLTGDKEPRLKLQIDMRDGSRLGPGKIKLLEAIDRAGSLSQGAIEMGISYRRAWLFMTQINETFDQPAISTPASGRGGAPSQLTDFGRELISTFRKMERDAERAAGRGMSWMRQHER